MPAHPFRQMSKGAQMKDELTIRNAWPTDLDAIISLDQVTTKEAKPEYWRNILSHYLTGDSKNRLILIAQIDAKVIGFIVGEVRAWEYGSPPCGWVFALAVSPEARKMGIGTSLYLEIATRWEQAGVATLRTMADRDDKPTLSFFRSMGLRTGSFIELEMQLD